MEEIYILRHGEAEDINECKTHSDFDRKLTEEGKEKTIKLSKLFNKLNEDIDLILTSPYIRAKETAEIFSGNFSEKPTLKTVDFLSSGTSSKDIVKGLISYYSYKKIILVGHAPDMEFFLGKLIGAEKVKLKKGALAKVALNNSIELYGELEWLITPRIINKLK